MNNLKKFKILNIVNDNLLLGKCIKEEKHILKQSKDEYYTLKYIIQEMHMLK